MAIKHLAFEKPFDDMLAELRTNVAFGNINVQTSDEGLEQYTYSKDCVVNRTWNYATKIARGIILDPYEKKIVGLPFAKFFNHGENEHATIPANMAFETAEKMDGSLIVVYYYMGKWRAATKGSFKSDQAVWAQAQLDKGHDNPDDEADNKPTPSQIMYGFLDKNYTYICEAIYPENRIVIHYDFEGLVLLGAYDNTTGEELDNDYLDETAAEVGWRRPKTFKFNSIQEPLDTVPVLSNQEEGYVLRFENGHRVKIKGSEYKRIHSVIARLTPLGIWEMMANGDNLDLVRKDIPEEFWVDFDSIRNILTKQFTDLHVKVYNHWTQSRWLSDKELGLSLDKVAKEVRPYVFHFRKFVSAESTKDASRDKLKKKYHEMIWRDIRPAANKLEGYRPSFAPSMDDE